MNDAGCGDSWKTEINSLQEKTFKLMSSIAAARCLMKLLITVMDGDVHDEPTTIDHL
jgi:hypothetical protein